MTFEGQQANQCGAVQHCARLIPRLGLPASLCQEVVQVCDPGDAHGRDVGYRGIVEPVLPEYQVEPLEMLSENQLVEQIGEDEGGWWPLGAVVDSKAALEGHQPKGHIFSVQAAFASRKPHVPCTTRDSIGAGGSASLTPTLVVVLSRTGEGKGAGQILLAGAKREDVAGIQAAAAAALVMLRHRAIQACSWGGKPRQGLHHSLRSKRDVFLKLMPSLEVRTGRSCGVPMVLALLRLYLGCRLKPKVVTMGPISLSGKVGPISGLQAKVEAAVKFGAELVVVPQHQEEEARNLFDDDTLDKMRFVSDITEVFELSVEGMTHVTSVLGIGRKEEQDRSRPCLSA